METVRLLKDMKRAIIKTETLVALGYKPSKRGYSLSLPNGEYDEYMTHEIDVELELFEDSLDVDEFPEYDYVDADDNVYSSKVLTFL